MERYLLFEVNDGTTIGFDFQKDSAVVRPARAEQILEEASSGSQNGYLSSVNLAELFYQNCRKLGRDVAVLRNRQVGNLLVVVDADEEQAGSAGLLKCRMPQLSIADCFALAVASRTKTTLLTTDSVLAKNPVVKARLYQV